MYKKGTEHSLYTIYTYILSHVGTLQSRLSDLKHILRRSALVTRRTYFCVCFVLCFQYYSVFRVFVYKGTSDLSGRFFICIVHVYSTI